MKAYQAIINQILCNGVKQDNRTGIPAYRITGVHFQHDMRSGFPAVTTKQLYFRQVVGELLGFLRGYDNAAEFRDLGCKVWDQNANENADWLRNPYRRSRDHLGPIYGVQWRDWSRHHDQLQSVLYDLMHLPDSRRMICTAWNPIDIPRMALPPCHVMWQVLTEQYVGDESKGEIGKGRWLDMCMYIRSWDFFLGAPFNIASYGLLLHLLGLVTGYKPRYLNIFGADVHLYENQIEQAKELVMREPKPLPAIKVETAYLSLEYANSASKVTPKVDAAMNWLTDVLQPYHIELIGYEYWPALKADMAV